MLSISFSRHRHCNIRRLVCLVCTVMFLTLVPSYAQTSYPSKPIRLIVPMTPGGANDILARVVGLELTESWHQPVVIDNRPGAGGVIGAQATAKAAADGYTIQIISSGFTIEPAMNSNLPFDPIRDFAPVSLIGYGALMLVVNVSLPVASVKELVQLARARPGELNYGTPGAGGHQHVAIELLKAMTGINLVHVPYKGIAPAINDLIAGHVQLVAATPSAALQYVKAGRLRALAVLNAKRSPFVPDLPTVAESGVPGYAVDSWWGIVAPGKTPPQIVKKMNADINWILSKPESRDRLARETVEAAPGTPEEFAKMIKTEIGNWRKVVSAAKINVE